MILLRAGWVLPVDRPPLQDGGVAVRTGRVVWVGRMAEAPRGEVRDLGPGVLLPGLVNAHCHLELSNLAGRLEGASGFAQWAERLVGARALDPPDVVRSRAAEALAAVEASGTAALGDVSNTLVHLDLVAASAVRVRAFFELIGWDPARAEELMAQAQARIASSGEGVSLSIAAHAPHSVSPALFRAMREAGGPAALHLAESPHERRFLDGGDPEWSAFLARRGLAHVRFDPPRRSPVRYMDDLGVLHPGLVAAHGVQVDAADCALLAARGVAVALCPRSNRALGVGMAPLPVLREAGVRLCVGTDSLASVPSLDLWEDVLALHRAWPGIEPEWLLRTATRGGAEALGFDDLGRIGSGAPAAFAFAEGPASLPDPMAFLFSGEARLRGVRP
ncbi:MAG TPA: amidohydrolase family protein [Vicinamibacteria bacterium]|nr:amidohydrolase family protein [Vicinamibacteria bacterium]